MDTQPQNPNKNREFFEHYGQCQNRIYSFLFMMVHNETDAEDLLQDTATTMLEKYDSFDPGTNFTAWGITIAKNKAINFLKKNSRSRPLLRDDFYQKIIEIENHEDENVSARAKALSRCLKKLDPSDQQLLKMRYEYDFTMKKIAEVLGRSKTGIYHSMARIQCVLYKCIKNTMAMGKC